MANSLLGIKIGYMVVVFILAASFTVIPTILKRFRINATFLSLINAFSGGIFISMAILHMLPEAVEDYEEMEEKPNERFKMPYFFAFIGYTLVLFIEKVVFKISEHDHGHSHDHRVHDEDKEHSIKEHVETNQRLEQREGLNRDPAHENHEHHMHEGGEQENSKNQEQEDVRENSIVVPDESADECQNESCKSKTSDHCDNQSHKSDEITLKDKAISLMTPIALLIALCIHAFFESLALGIEQTVSGAWIIVVAILAHKIGESLSLGISLAKCYKFKTYWIFLLIVFTFSISAVIGAIVGIQISEASDYVKVIFESLATGTFFYVGASHIISEEFENPDYRWIKIIAYLLGAFLKIFPMFL